MFDQEQRCLEIQVRAGGRGVKAAVQGLGGFSGLLHSVENLGAQQEVITLTMFSRHLVQDLQRVSGAGGVEDSDSKVQAQVSGRRGGSDRGFQEFSRRCVLLEVEE